MIVGLDSAIPPTPAQAAAATAAGIGMWAGYISEIPQKDGLYRPWTPADFDIVRVINPHPIAYTSGWDDPVATRTDATNRGYRLCLDVERLIRDDGPWVQAWLDASGAGLYGVQSVHVGRRAAFHIAAFYPTPMVDPRHLWPALWARPVTPLGWQWQNTHTEFGAGVDRSWLDDSFGGDSKMLRIMVNPRDGSEWLTDDLTKRILGPATASKMAAKYGNPVVEDQAVFDSIPEVGPNVVVNAPSYQGTVLLKPA